MKRIAVLLLAIFLGACDTTGVNTVGDDVSPPKVAYQQLDDVGFENPTWYQEKSAQDLADHSLAFASHRTTTDAAKSSPSYRYRSFSLSFA